MANAEINREQSVSLDEAVAEVAEQVRTETVSLFRTEARNSFSRIREALPQDERVLLVLRVDRQLEWRDIARILGEEDCDLDRESARLRKVFEGVKRRIKLLASEMRIVKG